MIEKQSKSFQAFKIFIIFLESYSDVPFAPTFNDKSMAQFLINFNLVNLTNSLFMIKPNMSDIDINGTWICDRKHSLLIAHPLRWLIWL